MGALSNWIRNIDRWVHDFDKVLEDWYPEKLKEETLAENYPVFWEKLRKRLRITTFLCRLMSLFLVSAMLSKVQLLFPFHLAEDISQTLTSIFTSLFILTCVALLLASCFRCPRCSKMFIDRSIHLGRDIFYNRRGHCSNCDLIIGKPDK